MQVYSKVNEHGLQMRWSKTPRNYTSSQSKIENGCMIFIIFQADNLRLGEEECFQTYLTMKDLYPNCIQANGVVYDKEKKEVSFSLISS